MNITNKENKAIDMKVTYKVTVYSEQLWGSFVIDAVEWDLKKKIELQVAEWLQRFYDSQELSDLEYDEKYNSSALQEREDTKKAELKKKQDYENAMLIKQQKEEEKLPERNAEADKVAEERTDRKATDNPDDLAVK